MTEPCPATERLAVVEQRLTRLEERMVSYAEAIHDMSRKLDDVSTKLNSIHGEYALMSHIQKEQVNGLTDLINRFTIWSDKSLKLESRVEDLEQAHIRALEEEKNVAQEKDRKISRWQWAGGFFITVVLFLLTIITWFVANLDFVPRP